MQASIPGRKVTTIVLTLPQATVVRELERRDVLISVSQIRPGPGRMRKSMSRFSEIQLSQHMASRSPGLARGLALV